MTKTVLSFVLICCSSTLTLGADVIKPGMSLSAIRQTLSSKGFDFNSALQLVSQDKSIDLEFCGLDPDTVLVIHYRKTTERVETLSVYFFPDVSLPKAMRQQVIREAVRINFDEAGTYSLTLKRKAGAAGLDQK